MRYVKLAAVVAIIYFAWKVVVPRISGSSSTSTSSSSTASAGGSCIGDAEAASEKWGSGIGRFANPPYDVEAWSSFRAGVETKIAAAEEECSCAAESCVTVRGAMRDLRGLISDLDSSIRNGSAPPGDVVQRQEAIDNALSAAHDSVRAGK